jgi:hypothetical protein
MNNALKLALDKGATMKMVAEDWVILQVQEFILQYVCVYVCMYVCMYVYISNGVESCLDSSCPAD